MGQNVCNHTFLKVTSSPSFMNISDGCSKILPDIGLASLLEDEKSLVCNQCVRKLTARRPSGDAPTENVDKDDPRNCPRCGKTVYFAEEQLAMGRKWHKSCFSCGKGSVVLH